MSMTRAQAEKSLRLISQAWGRKQSGYAFFPWIDRKVQRDTGVRRKGFHEGEAFKWPADREKIVDHLVLHTKDSLEHDIYWGTSLFEYPMRREDVAMDEHALWADLDAVDPSTLDEYPPTIAWESSPGRYQALWVAARGDFQGASWPGNENQKMTYMTGADASGWDTVQLLRIPGSPNHKPEYRREDGTYPEGKILWTDGPRYEPGDFSDLPELSVSNQDLTDALSADVDGVDRVEVIARVRLKMTRRGRELLTARETSGDVSSQLWYLIRCLADVGCTVAEIVAVVRETVWNKFRDRHDELRRLITEASKAIAQRSEEVTKQLEEEDEDDDIARPDPQRLGFLLKNIKTPKFLVDRIVTEGACGFIAGEPKCYKSWVALDLALSIATGAPFLGMFRVVNPGPVLYIQEEDPAPTLKTRSAKIWVGKSTDKIELTHTSDGPELLWLPPEEDEDFDPQVNAYIQQGLVVSSEAWQIWLDEVLTKGMDGEPYRLLLIDTLMMTAGDVDENRAQEMTTKIFKPLKTLSRKHNVALLVVHHMGKADRSRPGQRMLGSVANHAWAEDSMYLSRSGVRDIRIDLESKTIPQSTWRMTEVDNRGWTPQVGPWVKDDQPDAERADEGYPRAGRNRQRKGNASSPRKPDEALKALEEAGAIGLTTAQLADILQVNRSTAHKRLTRLLDHGVSREMTKSGSNTWRLGGSND
jgi:hypothetical protein